MKKSDQLIKLLEVDLVRDYWRTYLFISIAAIIAHILWLFIFGPAPSTDYHVVYDPAAKGILSWLAGETSFHSQTSVYGWSHYGYIAFIAGCYALFEIGSLKAVIYMQAAIVWFVYPLMFHILLCTTRRYMLSFVSVCLMMTFYDCYLWHFWAVPDSLYRLLFLLFFFILWRLWNTGQKNVFVWVTLLGVLAGTTLRVETALYAIPALWLSVRYLYVEKRGLFYITLLFVGILLFSCFTFLKTIISLWLSFQERGLVFEGLGFHVPGLTIIGNPPDSTLISWMSHFIHLFSLRLYYTLTPFPAFWSLAHKVVYASYIIPAYILLLVGLLDAIRRHDRTFLLFFWIFIAGLILRMLVHVDPPMRYGYTPLVFLFFCAAMGWPLFQRKVSHFSRMPVSL